MLHNIESHFLEDYHFLDMTLCCLVARHLSRHHCEDMKSDSTFISKISVLFFCTNFFIAHLS